MSVEVRVPELGESVVEATVGGWLKSVGQPVEAGDALAELETDKVNIEVTAERAGILERIDREVGDTVHPGDVLAFIGETTGEGSAAPVAPAETGEGDGRPTAERPHASPLARRIAEEHGLDLATVPGTGTAGRVMREDVERLLPKDEQPAATAPAAGTAPPQAVSAPVSTAPSARPADQRGEDRERMSRRRQTIATRLLEAQHTAAMLTTFNDVDMSAVMELRARRKEAFRERYGVGLGFMSFFTKAVVAALQDFPYLNAEIQGNEIVRKRYYDIGIAVSAEEGLVVPVVRDADRKSFGQIELEIAALAQKARSNALTLDDLRGGTFTITNGGVFGSMLSTPILSPPQVGILGMHRIEQRPVVRDGEIVVRPMMYLALTYDHRIVDGRDSVQFLVRVKQLIEDPEALMLGS
jgi:2-oxoglutarate dehydrogenase E2 component (dihydrolipoamide succinyltransferase)